MLVFVGAYTAVYTLPKLTRVTLCQLRLLKQMHLNFNSHGVSNIPVYDLALGHKVLKVLFVHIILIRTKNAVNYH